MTRTMLLAPTGRARAARWLSAGFLVAQIGFLPGAGAAAEPRLRVVEYSPNLVLPLVGFVGYHIHIEFSPDERFVTLASGDTSSLDVGSEGNHLLLKPKRATPGTNLTVLTNKRTYFIDFRALARSPRPEELVYSVTFRYPPDDSMAPRQPSDGLPGADLVRVTAARNRNYWFCGSAALRPAAVDDDGMQIRLTFPPHAELPAIYAATADGTEALVNSHVEDDTVFVHRLAQRLVLRRGLLVACVVNRSFNASARQPTTGTVKATVERTTRELEP